MRSKSIHRNPEDSGAIPYKTWMKLTDALTAAHAAGQAWVQAGRPRPSPLYDAYNAADRELLRQEEAAKWPYRGSAEQRKEWSRIHAHFDARKNPAPALYDAWVVVREKGPVLDPMGYASTLGPFFNKKQALAAKRKHGGRLMGVRPGHTWFGRNHPDTVRYFKGRKGVKEEVPWSIVEDAQHRTVRRFSTAHQAESWADYHGYPYDWEKGENVRTLRVRGRKAPIPNPGTRQTIVVAWVIPDGAREVVPGEWERSWDGSHYVEKTRAVPRAMTAMWLNQGTAADVKRAKQYLVTDRPPEGATFSGVFTYPTTEKDPLSRAKRDALAAFRKQTTKRRRSR